MDVGQQPAAWHELAATFATIAAVLFGLFRGHGATPRRDLDERHRPSSGAGLPAVARPIRSAVPPDLGPTATATLARDRADNDRDRIRDAGGTSHHQTCPPLGRWTTRACRHHSAYRGDADRRWHKPDRRARTGAVAAGARDHHRG